MYSKRQLEVLAVATLTGTHPSRMVGVNRRTVEACQFYLNKSGEAPDTALTRTVRRLQAEGWSVAPLRDAVSRTRVNCVSIAELVLTHLDRPGDHIRVDTVTGEER